MPTASAMSYMPEATYIQATWNAVEELAQAFSVLMIGMPPMPMLAQDDLAADHLLAGDQPRCRVADDGRFELRLVDAGGVERALDGLARDVLHAAVQELPEVGHPGADDGNVSHGFLLTALRLRRQYTPARSE